MKFFTLDDFHNVYSFDPPGYIRFYDAAALANEKLERESTVVYQCGETFNGFWRNIKPNNSPGQALLINIETIKPTDKYDPIFKRLKEIDPEFHDLMKTLYEKVMK